MREGHGPKPPIKGFAADIEPTLCMKCSEHMAARHFDSKDHRCQWILFQLTYSFTVCSHVLKCFSPSILVLALYILISPSQRPSPRFFSVSMSRMSSFSASTLHLARGGSAASTGLALRGLGCCRRLA